MSIRNLVTAAATMFVIAGATVTAQAGMVGPTSSLQSSAQSLNLTEKARRICHQRLRCPRFLQCHWERQCYVTADYPPEHGQRR